MDSDNMSVSALSRPFTLGMFYDALKDQLIPGFTLWDHQTIVNNTVKTSQQSSAFEISASESTESKSSLLDIEASLKASFLGGLVEVGGSAKYLTDQKKFANQSRVTSQYKATTNFKQLSMPALQTLDEDQINAIKKSSATHVVSGILYGANAFFVFDSEKLDASSVQNIQGQMQAVIKKIPSFNVEGKVDIKLTEEEKKLTEKFSCKFHGDFILQNNPSTFVDAVKTYVELPKLLGEDGENSVPVKVWLLPLKSLYPEAPDMVSEISVGLVRRVEEALDDLREMETRCNDSLVDEAVENFPQLQEEMKSFQSLCGLYKSKLQQTMKEKLPSIREGREDESSLKQLFEDREKSPFSHDKMEKWLVCMEREINVIRSCLEPMKGTKIVHNQSELDREVLAPGVTDALCFVFTSLEDDDPYIDKMKTYLDTLRLGGPSKDPWFYSTEVVTKMREKARVLHDLAKALKNKKDFCFLVAAIANKKYTGATIYQYKDGHLVTEDFSQPDPPPVETITDRRDLIWYACHLTVDLDTVGQELFLSEDNKKLTCKQGGSHGYPENPKRFKYPQFLCHEKLTGRSYWVIEWSDIESDNVLVGVAYSTIPGDSYLSISDKCWVLNHFSFKSLFLNALNALHSKMVWKAPFPYGCIRIGVFLDWSAGTLSFYRAEGDTLAHLYTFHTQFTDPVYPICAAYNTDNYVYLRPID
ncbi:neoverrucotoxin subunit beta-like isoform X1 [Melanotaenia boesemani]|uniref:neoverrucotoxin subunit beta-like isoform X1 n=1 Tax=Melanotaenia boesemani TaxID=1250792 RepID=UPI001C058286|nr:neoverrucotoxin subunit beta-like isoform X1 [Melanotaenia boesemani]XP_041830299.1 neoverrucotoxin subunit beta-like isoform X1 [Melanotaenia boesemani]